MSYRRLSFFVFLLLAPLAFLRAESAPPEKNSALKNKLETIFSRFLRRPLTIETVRWKFFPVKLAGTGIRLWESPGLLMGEAPRATTRISMKTLTSGRLRVHEMRFIDGKMYARFTHDGKINVVSMISDLAAYARQTYKPGQKQKVAYNLFRVENARLEVIDAETGNQPFGAPFVVNGKGDINGLGPQTQFPFHIDAVLASTATPMTVRADGTMSNRPQVHVEARRVPLSVLSDYLPVVRWFEGPSNAEFDFSKAGAYTYWKLRFVNKEIKTILTLPFPVITVDGYFHPYALTKLDVSLIGKPTRVDVALRVKDLITKKVRLTLKSTGADIAECIAWFQTGYIMGRGPLSEAEIKAESAKPLVWQVTGTADIDAELSSVLGQQLFHELDGRIVLKIRDGKLIEMPGFLKALALLKLTYIVQKDHGLPFSTVNGIIDIKNGVAQTQNPILLESPLMNVEFAGRVNFPRNAINARIRLGKVWFMVKGPLDKPVVLRDK